MASDKPMTAGPGGAHGWVPFPILCIAVLALPALVPSWCWSPIEAVTAQCAGQLLVAAGWQGEVSGSLISLNGFRVKVVPECTAVYGIELLGAFLLAMPATLRQRTTGLLWGAMFLVAMNTARIALVTLVGARLPVLFEPVHLYLGQVFMVLCIVTVCLLWSRSIGRTPVGSGFAPFALRFLVSSSLAFFAWLLINVAYVKCTDDYLVRPLFRCFGVRLGIPYGHMAYYQTFNFVTFAALVVASQPPWSRRTVTAIGVGTAAIVILHLLFRIANIFMSAFGSEEALHLSDCFSIAGQYCVPLLFWDHLVRGGAVGKGEV